MNDRLDRYAAIKADSARLDSDGSVNVTPESLTAAGSRLLAECKKLGLSDGRSPHYQEL